MDLLKPILLFCLSVIPYLRRFRRIGRRYLGQPPQSTEALAQLAALPHGAADALREYLHGDYLILCTLDATGMVVHRLSVRHHRELSFQFAGLWLGDSGARER
jgi:hypothetical protein